MKLEQLMKKMPAIGKDRFLLLFLMGLLCVIIAIPIEKSKGAEGKQNERMSANEKEAPEDENGDYSASDMTFHETEEGINTSQTGEYGEYIEKKLEQFLTNIEGAGCVSVFVSMQSSAELVVAHNTPYVRRSEEEKEGENVRSVTEVENESAVVLYEGEDGSQSPLVLKQMQPVVKGIVVACEGGNRQAVRQNISEALQALFGIEEHKIKVVKLNT